MALKLCTFKEQNSNATIKRPGLGAISTLSTQVEENPYEIIDDQPRNSWDSRVKNWLKTLTSPPKKNDTKSEGSLPVSRTSSSSSGQNPQPEVYNANQPARPVITNPIVDAVTNAKIIRNYTLIDPVQNLHDEIAEIPTYEVIQPLEVPPVAGTPPRYLDPIECMTFPNFTVN